MTNETDSFVQEVDESLRHDRLAAFFKKYGLWIGAGVAALILGVLGWQLWQDHELRAARAQAEEYAAAQRLAQEGDFEEAKIAFEALTRAGPRTYRVMAQLELAAVLEAQGDLQGALAGFDAAADQARDPTMRDTARMRAAYIAAETQDFDALRARLTPLIESDSRLSYLARELLAIEAWEAGQPDLARDQLENLTLAFDAPEPVRQRAQVALSVIGPAQTSSADGAPAPAPSEGETK